MERSFPERRRKRTPKEEGTNERKKKNLTIISTQTPHDMHPGIKPQRHDQHHKNTANAIGRGHTVAQRRGIDQVARLSFRRRLRGRSLPVGIFNPRHRHLVFPIRRRWIRRPGLGPDSTRYCRAALCCSGLLACGLAECSGKQPSLEERVAIGVCDSALVHPSLRKW